MVRIPLKTESTGSVAVAEDADRPANGRKTFAISDDAVGRAKVDERLASRQRLATSSARTGNLVDTKARPIASGDTQVIQAAGPRPRASMLATLALVLGVGSALAVLTGVLAGPGVAVGLLAAFLGVGGISATSRRHVAGKSDALLGLLLALGAVVVGCLSLTGTLPWLSPDSDKVMQVRDWLDTYLPWLFPNT